MVRRNSTSAFVLFVGLAAFAAMATVARAQPIEDSPPIEAPPPEAPPETPIVDAQVPDETPSEGDAGSATDGEGVAGLEPPSPPTPEDAAESLEGLDAPDELDLPDADTEAEEDERDEGPRVRYLLESIRIEGRTRTRAHLIREYVPLQRGDVIDPESDVLDTVVWALRGTGWFSDVRMRLERGHRRGWVVLVIEVADRNSVVVQQFQAGISEVLSASRDPNTDVLPYVGFQIAETNLLGTGTAISLGGLMSQKQQAVRVGFQAPRFLDSRFTLRLSTSYHNGREFYGHAPLVSASCGPLSPPGCLEELAARNAVVFYHRTSVAAGIGRMVGSSLFWSVDWVGDAVDVTSMPEAASELRGSTYAPIDFAIQPGRSLVASLRMSLVFDRRDDPNLTRRGVLFRIQGDVGSRLFGGSYDYSRVQATLRGFIPLPKRQVLRLSGFVGVITGDAPFFYLFHVSDLTDLIPSRILELDIDRRPAPNFFNTSIQVMRAEEFAARADVQWEISLLRERDRDTRALRGMNGFVNLGVYALSDLRELGFPPPGYHGFARLPVDATFDLGLRIDTDIGLFEVGFSNLLGFLDLRR